MAFFQKKIFTLIILFIAASSSSKAELKTVLMSLENHRYEITENRFFIADIIDLRDNKENIGFTKVGTDKYAYVNFKELFSEELQNYLNLNIKTGLERLHIAIDEFYISESSMNNKETGVCELSVYFFLETDSGYLFISKYNNFTTVYGLDVTKKQPKNIGKSFEAAFIDLQTKNIKPRFLLKSLENLKDNPTFQKIKFNLSIFKEDFKTGIYYSFEDFQHNNPSQVPFRIDTVERFEAKWERTPNFIPMHLTKRRKKIKDIWGFAINGEPYIYYNSEYFRVHRFQNEFYFYSYGNSNADYGVVAVSGLFFGAIGGAIAGAAVRDNIKKKKAKYALNPYNGNIKLKFDD